MLEERKTEPCSAQARQGYAIPTNGKRLRATILSLRGGPGTLAKGLACKVKRKNLLAHISPTNIPALGPLLPQSTVSRKL